jgi:hypothetical protein
MLVRDAARMARALMDGHGLSGWVLVFDEAKTRAGICRADRLQIGLSRVLTELHSEHEVRDTVLHEIAHALVGVGHGHDAVWRAKARAIGCSGSRCLPDTAATPPGRWRGVCPAGHETTRHRRPVRVLSCALCSPRFDPRAVLRWERDGRAAPMHPRYLAELGSLQRQLRR